MKGTDTHTRVGGLGPLLFLLASSAVLDTLDMSVAYADDTTGAAPTMEVAQAEIKELEAVSASVGLSLNGSKTQMMIIGGGGSRNCDLSLLVDGAKVTPSDTLDILGFRVDCKLGVNCYVDRLTVDLRKCLGILRMLQYRIQRCELRDIAYGILIGKLFLKKNTDEYIWT